LRVRSAARAWTFRPPRAGPIRIMSEREHLSVNLTVETAETAEAEQPPSKPPSSQPSRSLSDILSDLLQRAGVDKTSTIRVTGPAGLAALLWFCRHGYEQVGYVRAGPSPADDGDLVLAPQTCDVQALEAILKRGPHPRAGGVLIVQTPIPETADAGAPDPVHDLLARSGYRVERCLRGHHRELHVARRRDGVLERKAA